MSTQRATPRQSLLYLSLMNYQYSFGNCFTSPVQGYSISRRRNFRRLCGSAREFFPDVEGFLSASFGDARGEPTPFQLGQKTQEQTINDIIALNGPLDVIPPTVTITSPTAGAAAPPGSTVTVNITATDDVAIHHVTANFDINGDGIIETGESIMATSTGANTYQAVFAGVSGAAGLRTVSVIGWDSSSNTTLKTVSVNVGGSAPAPANILASAGTPQSTTVSTAFATALEATVTDAYEQSCLRRFGDVHRAIHRGQRNLQQLDRNHRGDHQRLRRGVGNLHRQYHRRRPLYGRRNGLRRWQRPRTSR